MEEILLKDICDLDNGYAFKSDDYIEKSDTLNCRMSNIRPDGTFDILYNAKYLPDEFAEKYKDYLLSDGDLIIAMTDMAGDPKILGVPTVVDTKGYNLLLNQRVGRLRFIREGVNVDYLKLALQCSRVRNYLKRFAGGGVQLNVGKKDILNAPVRMRCMEEQVYIANLFKRVLEVKCQREKELQLLDELIKARFVELFGNINENRFPKCKLRDVAHIKHGYAFSGEYFSDDDNGVVLVTPGNFALGGGFQEVRNRYFTAEYPNEYVLHAGDLIVTMTDLSKKADTLGYGAIVPDNDKVYLHNQRIGLFDKLDNTLNPVFVRWFMQTDEYRLEIVRTSTGSTVHHTSPDRILDSVIYLPPIEMQNKFVSFAEQVDKSKVAVQKSLEETQKLFDSLMQEYFG